MKRSLFLLNFTGLFLVVLGCGGSSGSSDGGQPDADDCLTFGFCANQDASTGCNAQSSQEQCTSLGDACYWCTTNNYCYDSMNASECGFAGNCAGLSFTQCAENEACKYCERTDSCTTAATEEDCSCSYYTAQAACDATDNNCDWCGSAEICLRSDVPCKASLKIFVTAQLYRGDIGILAMDTACQSEAQTAGLPGVFKAFVSLDGTNVRDRLNLPQTYPPYVRVDDVKVSDGYGKELLNTSLDLLAPINRDANNTAISSSLHVWTGTTYQNGNILYVTNGTCASWTGGGNTALEGKVGYASSVDSNWLSLDELLCTSYRRLYCLEQL